MKDLPRQRLLAVLSAEVVDAIEAMVAAEVEARLDARGPELLPVSEAAKAMGLSYRALDQRIRRGQVDAIWRGGVRLVPVDR